MFYNRQIPDRFDLQIVLQRLLISPVLISFQFLLIEKVNSKNW